MKSFIKIASFLAVISLLAPVMVFAVTSPAPATEPLPGTGFTVTTLYDYLNIIVNWVFAVIILLSVMFVILAAFQFVTGGPEKAGDARQKLIWAAVGIAFALLARAVPVILRDFLD